MDRLAHRLEVTPQWVGQLRRRLVESGELIVKQSRGRRPNVYIIPYERCPACQKVNPKLEFQVDEIPEDRNPKVTPDQPQSELSVTVLSRVRRHASSAPLACILPGDRRGGVAPGGHGTASSHGDHGHGSS